MASIEVDRLTKYYGETRGIERITFSVREGEVFGYLGPNGAGKTTTIRTLMGLQSPTDGNVSVLDYNVLSRHDRRAMKEDVGYLPSDPSFDESITGRKLLEHHASLKSDERRDELLELFDPPLDRTIREFSRGDLQTLAIVLAFMHDPDLVMMDEPTSGLDSQLQKRLYGFIHAEKQRDTTVFLTSHILSEVRTVCDRVGIVRNGHLVELEEIETLLDRGGKSVQVATTDPVDADDFMLDGVHDLEIVRGMDTEHPSSQDTEPPQRDQEQDGDDDGNGNGDESSAVSGSNTTHGSRTTVQFTYTGEYNALLDQIHNYTVVDIDISEPPLEEIFTRLYGERLGTVETGGKDV